MDCHGEYRPDDCHAGLHCAVFQLPEKGKLPLPGGTLCQLDHRHGTGDGQLPGRGAGNLRQLGPVYQQPGDDPGRGGGICPRHPRQRHHLRPPDRHRNPGRPFHPAEAEHRGRLRRFLQTAGAAGGRELDCGPGHGDQRQPDLYQPPERGTVPGLLQPDHRAERGKRGEAAGLPAAHRSHLRPEGEVGVPAGGV